MDWRHRTRQRMKELRITQNDIAKVLGVTQGAVGHYLRGRNEPSVEVFVKICQALDVSADWILFGVLRSKPTGSSLSNAATKVARAWEDLSKDRQRDIEGALRVFKKNGPL